MKISSIILTLTVAVAAALPSRAQSVTTTTTTTTTTVAEDESRPVTGIYALEVGGAYDFSNYLSPLFYRGTDFTFSGQWTKIFNHCPQRMVMRFESDINFQLMHNPAKTASMLGFTADFAWGLGVRFLPHPKWTVAVGGMVDIYGGALYLPRNGNNPVTALARASLQANASASFQFKMGRLPVTLVEEVRTPLLGAFFCPEYGETYYEIYLGNHKNLAHFGWPGNFFAINNQISLRLDFGRTAMTVGYRLDLNTFHANNLDAQTMRNSLVIGIIPGGLSGNRY